MMLRELLRECGYRVLEAASTDEAIAVLEKTAIPVDVVLSEIDIAGLMNGVGFAQWARNPPGIEDTARRNARAHGPQCG